jgi:hypothetical protein
MELLGTFVQRLGRLRQLVQQPPMRCHHLLQPFDLQPDRVMDLMERCLHLLLQLLQACLDLLDL